MNIQRRIVVGGGGSAGADGLYIYPQDESIDPVFYSSDTILGEEYTTATEANDGTPPDNWTVEFVVVDGEVNYSAGVNYTQNTALYDAVGTLQSVAAIPIRRDGNLVTTYGSYQEGIRCTASGPVVEFYGK